MSNWKYEKRPLDAIRDDIAEQVRLRKPFWNNLVSSYLEEVDFHYGRAMTHDVIRSHGLEALGWKLDGTHPAINLHAAREKVKEIDAKIADLQGRLAAARNDRQRGRLIVQIGRESANLGAAQEAVRALEAPPAPLPADKA